DRVEGRGADVAVDDAKRGDRQALADRRRSFRLDNGRMWHRRTRPIRLAARHRQAGLPCRERIGQISLPIRRQPALNALTWGSLRTFPARWDLNQTIGDGQRARQPANLASAYTPTWTYLIADRCRPGRCALSHKVPPLDYVRHCGL